jgi:hypothetical protein
MLLHCSMPGFPTNLLLLSRASFCVTLFIRLLRFHTCKRYCSRDYYVLACEVGVIVTACRGIWRSCFVFRQPSLNSVFCSLSVFAPSSSFSYHCLTLVGHNSGMISEHKFGACSTLKRFAFHHQSVLLPSGLLRNTGIPTGRGHVGDLGEVTIKRNFRETG